jgi:GNAT superfamily N-acetyltransferase
VVDIVSLADRPDLIPIVAGWHWHAWGHEDPTGSVEAWTAGLRQRSQRNDIPMSWAAVHDGVPVGSVSLIVNDMATHPELSPWLAGLYVTADHRGLGIGSALVEHCEATARAFGVRRMFLYTTTAQALYARHGWNVMSGERYGSEDVVIMAKELGDDP